MLLIFGLLLTFICSRFTVFGKNYPECYGEEKFNTFVASKKDCAKYIFCDGENSFEGECLGDNVFNEMEGNCDDPKDVVCHVFNSGNLSNENVNVSGNDDSKFQGNTSGDDKNNNNSNNKNNTNSGFITSSNGNQENKPIIANNPSNALSSPPSSPGGLPLPAQHLPNEFVEKPQCPQSSDQTDFIQLPNPTSCASYYTCYNGIAIPMICGRNMNFNEHSGKCEPQEQVPCALKRPVHLQCLKGIYDFIPHPRNCDYYYFCSNGFLMIFQCPFKYEWHYELRTCVHQSQSKCFSTSILQKMLLA